MPAVAEKPLVPPDEKFWQRYSPRHEFPLATVLSIFAHGCVIGLLGLAYFLITNRDRDFLKPPTMDAVMVDGMGDGAGGFGGAPGSPGEPKTELASSKENAKNTEEVSKFAATPPQENHLSPTPE